MKKTIALTCTAFMVVALGAALGCGGAESGMSPSEVADAYMRATIERDVDIAYDLMSEENKNLITKEQMEEMAAGGELEEIDITYAILEESIEGDTATVGVSLSITDPDTGEVQEATDTLNLVKESGEWKVAF